MNQHGLHRAFALSALTLALAACSAGSNTINSKAGSGERTECTAKNCVQLEFTDDPVVGLNYRCDTVVNVTDNTGVAKCPNNSNVTFYLRAKTGKNEVVLGTAKVEAVRSVTDDEASSSNSPLIRLTPKDLVVLDSSTSLGDLEGGNARAAINITRLLQSLRLPEKPFVASAPVNSIFITEDIKADIDKIVDKDKKMTDIKASDFSSDDVFTKLEPWLKARNVTVLDAETAKQRLLNTLKVIKAGVYYGTPTITLPDTTTSPSNGGAIDIGGTIGGIDTASLKLGIEGEKNGEVNNRATMATYMLTDRSGASMGQGMYWAGSASDSKAAYNLYRETDFKKLSLQSSLAGFNAVTDDIEQLAWTTAAVAAPSGGTGQPATRIEFQDGRLIRNFAMVGSEKLYRLYTGIKPEELIPSGSLGLWRQFNLNDNGSPQTTVAYSGTATIAKAVSVNTFLDPEVWRTKDTVLAGETYVFPLHVTLSFKAGAACPNGTDCIDVGQLGMTILEDGNIISDLNQDCTDVSAATLKQTDGTQEFRIGTVRAAYTSQNNADYFIGPALLLGNSAFSANPFAATIGTTTFDFDGVQVGTLALAPRVKMNITALVKAVAGSRGTVNVTDATSTATKDNQNGGEDPARWAHAYNTYYALKTEANRSDAQKELAKRFGGTLTAQTSACYVVKAKPAAVPAL